jgi:hypothetical protein
VGWAGVRWQQAYPHHLAKNLRKSDRGLASDTIYKVALRAEYSLISAAVETGLNDSFSHFR